MFIPAPFSRRPSPYSSSTGLQAVEKERAGKVYYCGTGHSRSDHASYVQALDKWKQIEAGLDAEARPPADPQKLSALLNRKERPRLRGWQG